MVEKIILKMHLVKGHNLMRIDLKGRFLVCYQQYRLGRITTKIKSLYFDSLISMTQFFSSTLFLIFFFIL